jgi:hypothetical protein
MWKIYNIYFRPILAHVKETERRKEEISRSQAGKVKCFEKARKEDLRN